MTKLFQLELQLCPICLKIEQPRNVEGVEPRNNRVFKKRKRNVVNPQASASLGKWSRSA